MVNTIDVWSTYIFLISQGNRGNSCACLTATLRAKKKRRPSNSNEARAFLA